MILNLNNIQRKPIVVSSNTTATNDSVYTVVANATFTDPTPVQGKGFKVFVRNGTAVIGGVSYGVNSLVFRIFHSGAWANTLINVDTSAFVPNTRTINGYDLSANRTLTASDVGAPSGSGTSSGTNTGDQDLSGLATKTTTITINGTSFDLSANRSFSAVMLHGNPVNSNAGTGGSNRWYGFSDQAITTTETSRRLTITNACTLKNFYIRTSGTQPASGSHVLTVLKNGVATSIVVTVPAGSAAGVFSDTTNSETFAQGDEISILAVNNASATSSIIISFSIGSV